MRKCKKCGEEKPLEDFTKNKGCRGGRRHTCKKCYAAYAKRYREGHRPSIQKYDEGHREVRRANAKRWREKNPKNPLAQRARHLKRLYGMTLGDYSRMLVAQRGVCKICGNPETVRRNGTIIALDVDHVKGSDPVIVRGLLCNAHNKAIGLLDHDPELLRKGADYVDAYRVPAISHTNLEDPRKCSARVRIDFDAIYSNIERAT